MTYMENLPQNFNIQHRVNGDWVSLTQNVGLAGYLAYLQRCEGQADYRAVDERGVVIESSSQIMQQIIESEEG